MKLWLQCVKVFVKNTSLALMDLTSFPGITHISNGFTRFATAISQKSQKVARETTADDDSLGTLLTGVLGQSLDGDRLNAY